MYDSTAPNSSRWFSIFMMGVKRIMGVVRRQEEALTVDQLMLIGRDLSFIRTIPDVLLFRVNVPSKQRRSHGE